MGRWAFRTVLAALVVSAAVWFGWHYVQFRTCGARTCASPTAERPIRTASGRDVAVLDARVGEKGRLVVEYLTEHDRTDVAALCEEAREVWDAVSPKLDTRRTDDAVLGPTNPRGEFLGMRHGVIPLYTCCVTTYLRAEKDRSGKWTFPDCPS